MLETLDIIRRFRRHRRRWSARKESHKPAALSHPLLSFNSFVQAIILMIIWAHLNPTNNGPAILGSADFTYCRSLNTEPFFYNGLGKRNIGTGLKSCIRYFFSFFLKLTLTFKNLSKDLISYATHKYWRGFDLRYFCLANFSSIFAISAKFKQVIAVLWLIGERWKKMKVRTDKVSPT